MFVYFIKHSCWPDLLKIGSTNQPNIRLRQIERATPEGYCGIVYLFETDQAVHVESRIHSILKYHGVRGEWFEVDTDVALEVARKVIEETFDEETNGGT